MYNILKADPNYRSGALERKDLKESEKDEMKYKSVIIYEKLLRKPMQDYCVNNFEKKMRMCQERKIK